MVHQQAPCPAPLILLIPIRQQSAATHQPGDFSCKCEDFLVLETCLLFQTHLQDTLELLGEDCTQVGGWWGGTCLISLGNEVKNLPSPLLCCTIELGMVNAHYEYN